MTSASRRDRGFTLTEAMLTVAVLVIVMGVMVSLARHVKSGSADIITRDILRKLDVAMSIYIDREGTIPAIPPILAPGETTDSEADLQQRALANNTAFIAALRSQNLLADRFSDLSVTYFDEAHVRDAWGGLIVFMPEMHPAIGMTPRGWFFFSGGPDHKYLTRDDNIYSYEIPTRLP